jgi:uncharacterized Zn-binding protein involved in type VI secretion
LVGTIGNMTAHGTPLSPGPGSTNIFIHGRSIWRASVDFHSCPVSDPKPHVGGVVLMGGSRILANNFQIAIKGDKIMEATSVNSLI